MKRQQICKRPLCRNVPIPGLSRKKETQVADNMELTSLTSLATIKTSAASSKEANESRFRGGKSAASNARGKTGFDGFLKTFLGDEKAGQSKKTTGLARGRNVSKSNNADKSGSLAALMNDAESARANVKSNEKTEAAEAAETSEAPDRSSREDVSDAAGEAAHTLWQLLYGQFNGDISAQGFAADGVAGGWTSGLDMTNVVADINSAAVLAAAEDMIGEMSDTELVASMLEALAGEGGDAAALDAFNRIALELGAEVVDVSGGEAELLASLAGGAVHTAGQGSAENAGVIGNVPAAAESAETFADTSGSLEHARELAELFSKFVEETGADNPALLADPANPETGGKLMASFAEWLTQKGNVSEVKQLSEHPNRFVQTLVAGISAPGNSAGAAAASENTDNSVFSKIRTTLESWLHSQSNGKANETGGLPQGDYEKKLNQGIFEETPEIGLAGDKGSGNHHAVGSLGNHQQNVQALARHDSTNPAAMSTMMDQIENIERLAEAMKMANRGGVKNLTMQLTPAELGKVMLRVESRDGVVNAYLRVEQPDAVSQLGSNLAQLRENLRAAGVILGEVTIEQRSGNETLGDFSGKGQGGNENGEPANRIHWKRGDGQTDSDPSPKDKTPTGRGNAGGLNLVA